MRSALRCQSFKVRSSAAVLFFGFDEKISMKSTKWSCEHSR